MRTDLSSLSAAADRLQFERSVRSIMERAGPELARRARRRGAAGVTDVIERWRLPLLAAAASIAIISTATLASLTPVSSVQATVAATTADSLDLSQLLFARSAQ